MVTSARIVRPLDRREIMGFYRHRQRVRNVHDVPAGKPVPEYLIRAWSCGAVRCTRIPEWELALTSIVKGTERTQTLLRCHEHTRTLARKHHLRFGKGTPRPMDAARGVTQ